MKDSQHNHVLMIVAAVVGIEGIVRCVPQLGGALSCVDRQGAQGLPFLSGSSIHIRL